MISEIYASGKNGVSAFVIVEQGVMVHYGSHRWISPDTDATGTVAFEGVSAPADELGCELMAVICAVMLCRNNHRQAVNIYTDDEECQRRYFRRECEHPLMAIFNKYANGIDIYADEWCEWYYNVQTRQEYDNPHVNKIEEIIGNKN